MIGIIILSIIQGITEFLPISSSAHLIIAREVLQIGRSITNEMALSFDLAVHFGTLIAIIIYFFKDLKKILINGISRNYNKSEGRIFWFIIIATIPAALVGFFGEEIIENVFRNNLLIIAITLSIMGIIIYLVDKIYPKNKKIENLKLKDVLLIGVFQIFAFIPGFSRSGTTITAGRIMNLERQESAKFAFYLAIPITLGAITYKFMQQETIDIVLTNINMFVIAVIVSMLTGILAISFLLSYIKKYDFKIFMWYRFLVAIIIIIYLIN